MSVTFKQSPRDPEAQNVCNMSFISKEDFTTHIYEDNINAISNEDDNKLDAAIKAAIRQVMRSLIRFDTSVIFAATGEGKEIYTDLIMYVKDIAKWHFIAVCNVNIDLELAEKRYIQAVKELDKIKHEPAPEGWPLLEDTPPIGSIYVSSSPKRSNYIN